MKSGLGRREFLAAAASAIAAAPAAAQTPAPNAAATPTVRVNMNTSEGLIVLELEAAKAPISTTNFLRYVTNKRYDGGFFYRSVTSAEVPDWGLIQGGINGKPGASPFPGVAHEPTTKTGILHKAGTISLARGNPGTASSEFFVCVSDQPGLDADPTATGDNVGFAAFGHVVEGMDVVKKIQAGPRGGKAPIPAMEGQMLTAPVKILTVTRA